MPIVRYQLGPMNNNTYLVVDEATNDAAIVDPSFDSEALWPDIQTKGYTVRYILLTHAHFDHALGNAFFAAQTQAPIALHRADLEILHALTEVAEHFGFEAEPSPEPTLWLEDGQTLLLGETPIQVLHTPGHAPGHVTFLIEDAALVGDVVFTRSVGRTDIPSGSHEDLMRSIRAKILPLPDEMQVLPGHGSLTTIARLRRENPYLQDEGAGARG